MRSGTLPGVGRALAVPDFRRFWAGETISMFGDQVAVFALPTYAILALGAGDVETGILRAMSTVAYPVLGLFVGAHVDRIRKGPVLIVADVVRCLAFLSIPAVVVLSSVGLAQLYVVALVASVFAVYFDVASQSYLPQLLPGRELADGNAKLELSSSVAAVAGPALAGLLVGWIGAAGAMAVNGVSFLASALGVGTGRCPDPPAAADRERRPFYAEITEGVRIVAGHRVIRALTVAAGLRNLGMAARSTALLLFLYHGLGLGAAAGVPALPGTVALVVVGSIWLPIWNANVSTLRQSLVPRHLLGRVQATARSFNLATIPVGALLGGFAAHVLSGMLGEHVGISWALCGCGAVAVTGLPMLLASRVHTLRELPVREQPA